MKIYKNIIVALAIAVILMNVYLILTNFNLNRQLTSISYISSYPDNKYPTVNQSNIKNLGKLLENSHEEAVSLINIIKIYDNHMNFEAEAETLDEIEGLHEYLSKIYDNKFTVNIIRQNNKFKALFEYNNQI